MPPSARSLALAPPSQVLGVVTVAAFRAFNRKIGEVAVFLGALLSATGASGDGGVHFKLARLASWCSGFGERERAASKGMLRATCACPVFYAFW
jgi:hypothetical protein